ncbi:hypothetical protein DUI87_01240 [Hirundo rustica rustica]|uniref:Uncharacterized protein n=1 Tax=Hirundo rustica rustica TaxID=333673 RepID=A0A3M0L5N7_HIRRU|nr:hypothetical protein DUI87_01240 [Hirundo rustica rustica]
MGQKQLATQMGQKPQASLVRQPQASLDARHLASLNEKNKTSAATSKLSEDQSQTKTTPERRNTYLAKKKKNSSFSIRHRRRFSKGPWNPSP